MTEYPPPVDPADGARPDGGLPPALGGKAFTDERQVPFYCPYCGETDLRPDGPEGGSWRCGSCARAFRLRFAGVTPAGRATS